MEPEAEFPRRFGKYVLLDLIAAGGMAEVFLAKVSGIEKFKRLIAIKCMRPELAVDQQFSAMFIDEANLAGQLQHANIAQIYELGRYHKQLYIAMELIEGRDLRNILTAAAEQGIQLPLRFAAYVARSAARGLDHAHRKAGSDGAPLNLVHRDISPANLLVSWEGEVKIVDFGIAKASARASETQVGIIKGKFAYMSPEQVNALEVDRRTDIFTLGTVLYELVTGEQLFGAETDFEVIEKVKWVRIPVLADKLAGMPPDLISALETALQRDASLRFQHASEFSKALEPVLIDDRSIFDAHEAAAFMATLFPEEEIVKARHATRALMESSTPVALAMPSDDEWTGGTETFHSDFQARSGSTIIVGGDDDEDGQRPAMPGGGDSEPDFWRAQTVQMQVPRIRSNPEMTLESGEGELDVDDPEADVSTSEIPAPEGMEADTADSVGIIEATGRINRNAVKPPDGAYKPTKRPGLGWLWVVGLFLIAGGLGVVLYLKQPPPEEAEVDPNEFSLDGDLPPDTPGTDPDSKGKAKQKEFGYVQIKVKGSKGANVFIDGKKVGRAPTTQRVKAGAHVIKVEDRKRKKRNKTRRVTVTKKHSKKSPQTIVINL